MSFGCLPVPWTKDPKVIDLEFVVFASLVRFYSLSKSELPVILIAFPSRWLYLVYEAIDCRVLQISSTCSFSIQDFD